MRFGDEDDAVTRGVHLSTAEARDDGLPEGLELRVRPGGLEDIAVVHAPMEDPDAGDVPRQVADDAVVADIDRGREEGPVVLERNRHRDRWSHGVAAD